MWYKDLFEILFQTPPLFNNFFLDLVFPAAIVFFLYDFAFGVVGGLYKSGVISGRNIGSIIHWGIRYGLMWVVIQILIFVRDNWLFIVLGIIILIALAILLGIIYSKTH